jgi:parallel beta-helix repeat protein
MKRKALDLTITLLLLAVAGLLLVDLTTADPIPYLPNILIKSDGSVEPETEFIKQDGNVYTLTADLVWNYAIKIQCSNIVFDGAGHVINGGPLASGYRAGNDGLSLQGVTNVTVRNLEILGFDDFDVSIENCNSCIIQRVKANTSNINNSHLNIIKESKIAGNKHNVQAAIIMRFSNNNKFYRNNITGIILEDSDSNIFFENNIVFQHTFIFGGSENNLWDNSSVGNHWGDYQTKYSNASEIGNTGIGDTPYVIDADNIDYYPLVAPVDNTAPAIEVLSPAPGTYNASSIQLSFTVDEPASLIAYSLDGKENITVTENITLTGLANGVHDLTIYAKDKTGNTGASETICFSVAVPFPTALVAAASVAAVTVVSVVLLVYFKKRRVKSGG